ncbi:MAG: effector-associated domain EAD1-containing protein [Leptolyngbyaceae cyanobacterium MO_188.B28]|nr:effector-associated domain EAD1-containing protein [Leptolyngbyaceae cyanobacterium MO_188.B28]
MTTGNLASNRVRELTGEQLASLCRALEAAIEEETLPQMLTFRLGERLRNIKQANTYSGQIFNLIEWAETKYKIRQLVIAASLENPSNRLLQEFVQAHLQGLLELDSLSLSDEVLLSSLLQALTQILDFTGIIWAASTQTLPDIETSAPELRTHLVNNELHPAVKWLMLFELFLKTWRLNDQGQLYIVRFVENLAYLATGSRQVALNQWLSTLPEAIRPAGSAPQADLYPDRPSDETLKTIQAYFLITVEPFETVENEYGVNGYVITRLGNEDRYSKIERIPLPASTPEEPNHSLQAHSSYTLEHIKKAVPDWLVKATEVIFNQSIEIQKNYDLELPPALNVTVEFWLPFEHLSADIESWKIYGQPTRLKRRTRILGKEYAVVVRSYDRFIDLGALSKLNQVWQAILVLSQNTSGALASQNCFDCWTQWKELQLQVQHAPLGVALMCPICAQQYQRQREDLFAWMLERGIPLVLWSRCADLGDDQKAGLKQTMHDWLTTANLTGLEQLFDTIKQARAESDNHQLALWCDEPKRLIELKQFRERGRLRA